MECGLYAESAVLASQISTKPRKWWFSGIIDSHDTDNTVPCVSTSTGSL